MNGMEALRLVQDNATSDTPLLDVRLDCARFGARDINLYEFVGVDGRPLPDYSAGAHIDVHLANGLVRQYSLIDLSDDRTRYVIAVKREAGGRGGSKFLHDSARVGASLKISAPRNNFPLDEGAGHSVLIAGGIGVTPIFTMWKRLVAIGRPVEFIYSCRSRSDAIFLDRLESDATVTMSFDDENDGRFLDIATIVGRCPDDTHLYCCGPGPMLSAFEAATADWPAEQVHVEYFSARAEQAPAGGFVVELARSGMTIPVENGQTILEAIIAAGIDAPYSCEEGVCGACATAVIDGTPDHRDSVMTPAERQENKKIMICCSGSKTPHLVLDI